MGKDLKEQTVQLTGNQWRGWRKAAEFTVSQTGFLLSTVACLLVQRQWNMSGTAGTPCDLHSGGFKISHTDKLAGSWSWWWRKNKLTWFFYTMNILFWFRYTMRSIPLEFAGVLIFYRFQSFGKPSSVRSSHACTYCPWRSMKNDGGLVPSALVFADVDLHSVCSCGCCGCWLLSDRFLGGH